MNPTTCPGSFQRSEGFSNRLSSRPNEIVIFLTTCSATLHQRDSGPTHNEMGATSRRFSLKRTPVPKKSSSRGDQNPPALCDFPPSRGGGRRSLCCNNVIVHRSFPTYCRVPGIRSTCPHHNQRLLPMSELQETTALSLSVLTLSRHSISLKDYAYTAYSVLHYHFHLF